MIIKRVVFAGLLLVAAGTLCGSLLLGHHAATMFDTTKVIEIIARVKELQWTNPHIWIQIEVQNAYGVRQEWSIEGGGPNSLSRQGWRPTRSPSFINSRRHSKRLPIWAPGGCTPIPTLAS